MVKKDLKNGKIYQILNSINEEVYIGSTCQPLSKRMVYHRSDMKTKKMKLYDMMKELGVENFYIELVEEYPCDNIEQLRQREGYYIRQLGTLNSRVDGRTLKEWRQDNAERLATVENKERIAANKKAYRERHLEKIKAKEREYEQLHKTERYEKAKAWKSTKIECECGGCYRNSDKSTHIKTQKHQLFVNSS
jgi:group I intron endonuclease